MENTINFTETNPGITIKASIDSNETMNISSSIIYPDGYNLRSMYYTVLTEEEIQYCENIANILMDNAVTELQTLILAKQDPCVVYDIDKYYLIYKYNFDSDKTSSLGVKMQLIKVAGKKELTVVPIDYNKVLITL